MFFKKLRKSSSPSDSPSKSNKPSVITRITSVASSHESTRNASKVPAVMISAPTATDISLGTAGRTDEEERDYQQFLDKAKKDAEKQEKKRLREIQAAREVNLSPWASRMR